MTLAPAAPPAVDEIGTPSPSRRAGFLLAWTWLAVVAVALTWIHPGVDASRMFNHDLALSIDGYWYLADARSIVLGQDSPADPQYQSTIFTAVASLGYFLFGVGYESSRVPNALASLACLALLATLMRRTYGDRWTILGCTFLILHPAWLEFIRSPVIYPVVAAWWMGALVIARRNTVAALIFAGVGGLFLKSICFLIVPALGVDLYLRHRHHLRRYEKLWKFRFAILGGLPLTLGLALGPWTLPIFWRKIGNYLGGPEAAPVAQLLSFESRSDWFAAFPLLHPWALIGALLFLAHVGSHREGPRRTERLVHLFLWSSLPLFAFAGYSPLRYLIAFFPILVFGAVAGIAHVSDLIYGRRLDLSSGRGVITVFLATSGVIYTGHQWVMAYRDSSVPLVGLGIITALASFPLVAKLGLHGRRWIPACCVIFFLTPATPRLLQIAGEGDDSLVRANRELASVLPDDARVAGPYAHALTVDSHLAAKQMSGLRYGNGQLADHVRDLGASHLITDSNMADALQAIFAREGVPLEPLEVFHVRGEPVRLYRLPTTDLPLSPFEEGIRLRRAGHLDKAEDRFARVTRAHPDSGSAWGQLGLVLLHEGRTAAGKEALDRAIECDPTRVSARLARSDVALTEGDIQTAIDHLEQVLVIEPGNRFAVEKVEDLMKQGRPGETEGSFVPGVPAPGTTPPR